MATYSRGEYSPAVFNDTIVEVNPIDATQQVVRARNKQMLFDRIPYKAYDAKFNTGDIGNNV